MSSRCVSVRGTATRPYPALATARQRMVSVKAIGRPLRFRSWNVQRCPAGVAGVVSPVQKSDPAAPSHARRPWSPARAR